MTRSKSVRLAVSLFRAGMILLPRPFRARHEAEMVFCFAEIAAAAHARRGLLAVPGVLLGALADLCRRGAVERRLTARRALRDTLALEGIATPASAG